MAMLRKRVRFQTYPPKDFCTARYEHKSSKKKFQAFQKTRKKKSWADLWPRSASEKLSQMLIRSGDIPSPRQMSIDKTNYCAMKSERGARCVPCAVCHALVRGSDPPSGHSVHKTTGDTWRAPARHLIRTHLGAAVWKTGAKILDSSPMAKNRAFFQVWEKSVGRRGQLLTP